MIFPIKEILLIFGKNLPTPSNYFLGPGDELVISIWGETQIRSNFTISRDGKIFDPKVGLLNLSGKTIEEASSYLKINMEEFTQH